RAGKSTSRSELTGLPRFYTGPIRAAIAFENECGPGGAGWSAATPQPAPPGPHSFHNAPRMGIDDEAVGTEQTDQGDLAGRSYLDCKRRRRADRDEDGNGGDRRLLEQFERRPTADQEKRIADRQAPLQQKLTHDLVDRV